MGAKLHDTDAKLHDTDAKLRDSFADLCSTTYSSRYIVMSPENSTLSVGKSLMYRRLYLMMVSDRNLPTLCLTSPATSGCVAASVMNTRCRGEPRLCWNTEASILDTIELSTNLREV